MQTWNEFRECLRTAPSERVVDVAVELLAQPFDWPSMLADHLMSVPDDELVRRVLDAHIAHVQPRVYMIDEIVGKARMILHHFDKPTFNRCFEERLIGPHYHHFPFATRILRGSYYQWLFTNHGSLADPDLSFDRQVRCTPGDVYKIAYDRFHCVLMPEHESMSFMVRGPAVVDPGHCPEPGYGAEQILELRPRLLDLLRTCGDPAPGRVVDIGDGQPLPS